MAEKAIEGYLRDEIKKLKGVAFKFVSPGNNGVPDRMVCLPGGRIVFVETKDKGKTSTVLQKKQQERLRALGFTVHADVDSREKVDQIIQEIQK